MKVNQLNQKELKRHLHYDPETGIFTRKISNCNRVKVGDIAGTKHKGGYLAVTINYETHLAHRLAWLYMTGFWPKNHIDHDNHIRNDNRWINLCDVTQQENNKNISLRKRNVSGCAGVTPNKEKNKWECKISLNGKSVFLGYFKSLDLAISTKKEANIKHGFHENHGRT